ncbi:PepSY domain-containing protein [Sphingomonas sp. ABOLE]|uniref:PepSY-associated TM helix domain-containing protein n=1 Tax=Sphingomonas sp. ABOLE TaxID=1985878 RepID=UPI000F7E4A4F|nr:PepSY-associated TM helix domain-containing protein [Sphingomonas sp. ABOLE]RSV40698.1 PepSY domain-containing protein [Sphingomonas sp. ABOLE]
MHLLALLHRWIGAIGGLLLALLGLTGTLLVWRDELTFVAHAGDPVRADPASLAKAVAMISGGSQPIDRVTFAGDGLGVHQVVFKDGSGAYLSQAGETVARWSASWQRPELWLFDLHHRLLIGDTGETITGVAGLVGLFFVVTGILLWWRTRRRFRLRAWPMTMKPGAIVHHHRDLGVVAAPLLLVSLVTGVLMVFPVLGGGLLAEARPRPPRVEVREVQGRRDLRPLFEAAAAIFPGAEFRRLQWPRKAGAPIVLRLRQPFEWTPNGRTFVYADPATLAVVGRADPAAGGLAASIREKLYPVHAAKIGGPAWKLAMSVSGIALTLLGSLAVYAFWRTQWNVRRAKRRKPRAKVE